MRFEQSYKSDDMINHTEFTKPLQSVSSISPKLMLTNGAVTFIGGIAVSPKDKKVNHRGMIVNGTDLFDTSFHFPLNLGLNRLRVSNVGKDLDDAINNRDVAKSFELDTDVAFEGRNLYRVVLRSKSSQRTYWIDAERGGVPLQVLDNTSEGTKTWQTNYEMLKRVGNHGWLPFRKVRYNHMAKRAKIMEIKQFDSDFNPQPSDFTISFPEPITIIDTVHNRAYGKKSSLALLSLSVPSYKESNPIRVDLSTPLPRAPVLPPAIESPSRLPWVLVCTTVALLLVIGYRTHKRQ
jgi:hypothetical protein